MIRHFKKVFYLLVFIWFSTVNAGSYEDFFSAVKQDNDRAVRALLKRGFDPNTPGSGGETGLILAVREPSFKVITALLEHSATQVEFLTASDESALMLAALRGYFTVCEALIARDADVNKTGWTPLHYAATGGHLRVLQLLLDSHAYVDAASPNGSTPLMMAAMYGTVDAVKVLLEAGADPSLRNGLGLTAIDFATQVQRDDVVNTIASSMSRKN